MNDLPTGDRLTSCSRLEPSTSQVYWAVHSILQDMMNRYCVTDDQVQAVLSTTGYYQRRRGEENVNEIEVLRRALLMACESLCYHQPALRSDPEKEAEWILQKAREEFDNDNKKTEHQ